MTKNNRHENPAQWMNNAVAHIARKIEASPVYAAAREEIVKIAAAEIGPQPSVEHMRALGGFSAVVKRAIAAATTAGLDENCGSKFFPTTVRQHIALTPGSFYNAVRAAVTA